MATNVSSVRRWSTRRCRSVVTGGENPDPRELGIHFNRFTTGREDRLRRLAALTPALGDRHVPPRVAGGSCRGSGRRARDRRLRTDEPAGDEGDPCRARRASPSRSRSSSSRSRTSGARDGAASRGRPSSGSSAPSTCSTSRTGCIRPSVLGSARRRSMTSYLCATRSGCRAARAACTRRSTGTPRAQLRPRLRELAVHGA